MSAIQKQQARPAHMQPLTEEELEREALAWCERMEGKFQKKKSNYTPKRRRWKDRQCPPPPLSRWG